MNNAPGNGFEYHDGSHAAFIPEEDRATWITSLDAYDRHVLNFVLTWAPFGGHSDDDAFPEFGLNAQQLGGRFEEIADRGTSSLGLLNDWDANLIRRAQRLLMSRAPRRVAGESSAPA
jgi:hypothetical protein